MIIEIASLVIAIVAAYIALRAYQHQKGELLVCFSELAVLKNLRDKSFEENIGPANLKITNIGPYPVTVSKIYVVLTGLDGQKVFASTTDKSCVRKLLDAFSKTNVIFEHERNQIHVNLLAEARQVNVSESYTVSLATKLLGENLCCKYESRETEDCLQTKDIMVNMSSGKTLRLPRKQRNRIQKYCRSLAIWKYAQPAILEVQKTLKLFDVNVNAGGNTDEQLREAAIKQIEHDLGLWK